MTKDEYIKRSDALELTVYQSMMGLNMAQTKLREMPGEDVRPVVHGHWKNWKDEHTCSVCRGVVIKVWGDDEYDYCPYCGNPMDEKEEE